MVRMRRSLVRRGLGSLTRKIRDIQNTFIYLISMQDTLNAWSMLILKCFRLINTDYTYRP